MVHAELPLQNQQVTLEVMSKLKYKEDFDQHVHMTFLLPLNYVCSFYCVVPLYYRIVNTFVSSMKLFCLFCVFGLYAIIFFFLESSLLFVHLFKFTLCY